jgi:hypothetical protein
MSKFSCGDIVMCFLVGSFYHQMVGRIVNRSHHQNGQTAYRVSLFDNGKSVLLVESVLKLKR